MEGPAPTRAIPESGAAATAHDAPTNKHDGPVVVMEGALATPSQSSGASHRRGGTESSSSSSHSNQSASSHSSGLLVQFGSGGSSNDRCFSSSTSQGFEDLECVAEDEEEEGAAAAAPVDAASPLPPALPLLHLHVPVLAPLVAPTTSPLTEAKPHHQHRRSSAASASLSFSSSSLLSTSAKLHLHEDEPSTRPEHTTGPWGDLVYTSPRSSSSSASAVLSPGRLLLQVQEQEQQAMEGVLSSDAPSFLNNHPPRPQHAHRRSNASSIDGSIASMTSGLLPASLLAALDGVVIGSGGEGGEEGERFRSGGAPGGVGPRREQHGDNEDDHHHDASLSHSSTSASASGSSASMSSYSSGSYSSRSSYSSASVVCRPALATLHSTGGGDGEEEEEEGKGVGKWRPPPSLSMLLPSSMRVTGGKPSAVTRGRGHQAASPIREWDVSVEPGKRLHVRFVAEVVTAVWEFDKYDEEEKALLFYSDREIRQMEMEAEGPLPDSDSENDNEEESEADDQEEHVVGAFGASSLKSAPLKGSGHAAAVPLPSHVFVDDDDDL